MTGSQGVVTSGSLEDTLGTVPNATETYPLCCHTLGMVNTLPVTLPTWGTSSQTIRSTPLGNMKGELWKTAYIGILIELEATIAFSILSLVCVEQVKLMVS